METNAFFRQDTSQDAIVRYSRARADWDIGYLLDHDYKTNYLEALQSLAAAVGKEGIRIVEFGSGTRMTAVGAPR
jgi:hypothetical protein